MGFGLTFIDGEVKKHTFKDFGLRMVKMYIPEPEPKINIIEIPYSSSNIDFTEVTGNVNYNNRDGLEFEFKLYDGRYTRWSAAISELAMFLHGKSIMMVPDNDTSFYYMVRLTVDSSKSNSVNSSIVLKGTADPFKTNTQSSTEDWVWDSFNFHNGVIRKYYNINITNGGTFTIRAGGVPSIPSFIVTQSTNLAVVYNGKSYPMTYAGTYRFPQISVGNSDVTLTFTGSGKLSIEYRGKYL